MQINNERKINMEDMSLGKRLKNLREKSGFTVENIASLLGINAENVLEYESGTQMPTMSMLETLSGLYCHDLIHKPSTIPAGIRVTAHMDDISTENMKAIQAVHRIMYNSLSMTAIAAT